MNKIRIPNGKTSPVTTKLGLTFREIGNDEISEASFKSTVDEHGQVFAVFNARLIAWPFEDPCDKENKLKLVERSIQFAVDQLKEANEIVSRKRKEEIENLLSGVNGTTHPTD